MKENQVLSPLAAEILDTHNHAQAAVGDAKGQIERAVEISLKAAALVETAKSQWGREFSARWRDEVGLSPESARRYMTLHKTQGRRIDKAQLLLLGVVDPPEGEQGHHKRTPDPFSWAKHVAKAKDQFPRDQINRMTTDQKQVARSTLKPLVELYELLG